VEAGASRREAAERFDLSPSAAIKWVKRYYERKSAICIIVTNVEPHEIRLGRTVKIARRNPVFRI